MCAGLQKKEDPDTLGGFFRLKVEHTGRLYHVLALPRDAQGRKLKTNTAFRRRGTVARASYYRVIRPATGFSSNDYPADSEFSCPTGCDPVVSLGLLTAISQGRCGQASA